MMPAATPTRIEGTDSAAPVPYPSTASAWYAVWLFWLAYTLAFVDRQIMAFLVAPIRADFHLSDFQFSLIQGLAFVLFYSVLGVPIARLADTRNRRNIIALGVALWSLMTALCGMAGSFAQLFLARLGVGVGEASLSPSAISIIADTFPQDRRAMPINLYSAGVHAGAGLASFFGGLVVSFTMAGGGHSLPLIGLLKPWQMALVLVSLPGIIVALAVLTVREPPRRERVSASSLGFGAVLEYLGRNAVLYATLMIGAAFAALASFGTFSWVPALYQRHFGWTPVHIGSVFGAVTVLFGISGLLASGALASHLAATGRKAPYTWIMVGSMGSAILPAALLMAVPNPWWTMGCLALLVFLLSTPIGLVQTALQAVTPNQMRAQVIAVYLLATALIGSAAGPASVAAVTDFWFHDDRKLGSSIAVVATAAAVLSTLILRAGVRAYTHKVEHIK
ncbi:MAG TPA: MFS transporter [Steroidobacteraceae bacterium]|jgi:MFS family permease